MSPTKRPPMPLRAIRRARRRLPSAVPPIRRRLVTTRALAVIHSLPDDEP